MLLNRFFLIIFINLILVSCDNKEKAEIPKLDLNNKEQVLQVLKNHFDKDISQVFIGNFDDDKKLTIVACAEKMDSTIWGIQFFHITQEKGNIKILFKTEILQGSLKDARLDKIKIFDSQLEHIYYNSLDYFMGSGGGEIFSYIIDFKEKQVYYSHFVNDIDYPYSLYISENVNDLKLRNFIISIFKRDYPKLKIVEKDIELD